MLALFLVFAIYLLYVRTQRFKRIQEMQASYAESHREPDAEMTPVQAQKILLKTMSLEGPFISQKSLEFALFRVRTTRIFWFQQVRSYIVPQTGVPADIRY